MKKRKFHVSPMMIVFILLLTFAFGKLAINIIFTEKGTVTSYSANETIAILNDADEIRVCKNYRTIFYKDYNIIVDGKNVATVSGKFFKLFGDTFTMKSSNGEEIMSEKEEVFHFNHQAQFYDAAGNKNGRLEGEYFALLDKDRFYNANGLFVAKCEQKFSIPRKYVISCKDELYLIKKEFWFDNYTIKVKDNTELDPVNAIMINCIKDAIASSSKGNSSNNSK